MSRGLWSDTPCATFEVASFQSGRDLTTLSAGPSTPSPTHARVKGSAGGAWTPCTHLREVGLNLGVFLMRFLAFELKPSTVLEFGCGLGTTADYLARFVPNGTHVTCIEPEPMLSEVFSRRPLPLRPTQLAFDALEKSKASSRECARTIERRGFDLVYSFEVAEHVSSVDALVPLLARSTRKWLVFSAAHPGQIGIGHRRSSMLSKEEVRPKLVVSARCPLFHHHPLAMLTACTLLHVSPVDTSL